MASILTKRWDEPVGPGDGTRILITRYRPRALPKAAETWSLWLKPLAPSAELLGAFQGKGREPIAWETYRTAYLREMRDAESQRLIGELAARVTAGETITLLCSSSCLREARCHRSLLRDLIMARASARG